MTGSSGGSISVIIIGGGASGVLLAIHLLRHADADLQVSLIEKRPDLGKGVAYSTMNPAHLLNVAPLNMSAFPDDPEHFWRWLIARGEIDGSDPFIFVPRRLYGDYLNDLITRLAAVETARGRLRLVRAECISLAETATGIEVGLSDGAHLVGRYAVLAAGHDGQLPVPDAATSASEDPVLILGTGLSMVDAWLSLRTQRPNGSVIVLSRRGLLPQVHKPVPRLQINVGDVPLGTDPAAFLRWLRAFAKSTQRTHGDWRTAIDALRPFNQSIWRSWSPAARRRFLEHARPWWDVHRHRMPPASYAQLDAAVRAGQVAVIAGKIQHIEFDGNSTLVAFRRRYQTDVETVRVAGVYDCRGISGDGSRFSSALVRGLIDRRQARADPQHISLDVTADCALIDADGRPWNGLYAIGPLSRGTFFEIEAVPDIRVQCANLAQRLLGTKMAVAATDQR